MLLFKTNWLCVVEFRDTVYTTPIACATFKHCSVNRRIQCRPIGGDCISSWLTGVAETTPKIIIICLRKVNITKSTRNDTL